MPQFTYDDLRNKILKRERYKFALNYHQQFFPIFKENTTLFDESKGYKRFLRLIRFYTNLPKALVEKYPKSELATIQPKMVNFVRLNAITCEYDLGTKKGNVTLNSPYNYVRCKNPAMATDVGFTGANILASTTLAPVEKTKTLATLTEAEKKSLAYRSDAINAIYDELTAPADISGVPPLTIDELAKNENAWRDSREIHTLETTGEKGSGCNYEFFGTPDPANSFKKSIHRPTFQSTVRVTTSIPVTNVLYKEDRFHDGELLPEMSLSDNRILISLFENIRSPAGYTDVFDSGAAGDITKMADETAFASNTFQFPVYADRDKPLYLNKYNYYDMTTGARDNSTATAIVGTVNESTSVDSSLRQYITCIQAFVEFEVILVDMKK